MSAAEKELRIRIAGRVDNSLTAATAAAQQQVSGLGSKLATLGKAAIAGVGGLAVGAVITDTVNTYKDFDQAMAQTAATAGATGADYQKLQDAAMAAGRGTTKTATEAAQALGYLALAGYDVNQSTQALTPILKLSEATQMDLATCSDLVTDSMSAAGVAVADLPGYLDVLCKANNKSNQTAGQLMEAMIAVGGTMKGLNVPIEETSTALGVLANRGIKGAEGGTALNSIMANLTTGTGQAGEMMEKLGISAFDSNGKFIGVQATLMKLNDATKDLTEEQRNAAFAAIGGKEQVKALNALMQGLNTTTEDGSTEWNALHDALVNSGGSLEEMNAQVTNTLSGAMARFGSALDDIKIRAGLAFGPALATAINYVSNNLMPMLSAAMDGLGPILSAIGNELRYVGSIIADNWGVFAPIVAGIGVAFGTWKLTEFVLGIPQAISGIQSMIVATKALTLAKIADKIETMKIQALYWKDILLNARAAAAMGVRTVATATMTAATAAWGVACTVASVATTALSAAVTFLTSPIGIAIAAIAAIVAISVLLYKNWDMVKAKAAELYTAFAGKFPHIASIIEKVFSALGPKIQGLVTAIGWRFGQIKDLFAQKWTEAIQFLGGLMASASGIASSVSAFITPIVDSIILGFQSAYQWVSNLFTTIGGYVSIAIGYLTQFVAFIGDVFSAGLQIYLDAAVAVFSSFGASIGAVIDATIIVIGGIIDFLTGVFMGNWSMAWQGIVDIFGGIFSGIEALAAAPINAVIALLNSLISKLNSVSFDVPDWVPGMGGKHFGFSVPSIPALASGGVATSPTLAMIGEGSESEAVLPLSKLQGMLDGVKAARSLPLDSLSGVVSGRNNSGISSGVSSTDSIVFSPQISIQGNASKEDVLQATAEAFEQFKGFMARYEREHKRFAFSQ